MVWSAQTGRRGHDHAIELKQRIVDPMRICRALGLLDGAKPQAGGVIIRCPFHGERNASCSVQRGEQGTVRVVCFACGAKSDLLGLVAARHGLDLRTQFVEVLAVTAEVGGLPDLAAELRGGKPASERPTLPPSPEPLPERAYPPQAEVVDLWERARPVAEDPTSAAVLSLRGLFPGPELARAINGAAPNWARFQGRSWADTHRVILPMHDHLGELRSLRAWKTNINDTEAPKRLPAAGCKASGLALANDAALSWLRSPGAPVRVLIAEGEPDYLSLCQRYPGVPAMGVTSGTWSQAWADRVPFASEVHVFTDHDQAGDKYATEIANSLKDIATVRRFR